MRNQGKIFGSVVEDQCVWLGFHYNKVDRDLGCGRVLSSPRSPVIILSVCVALTEVLEPMTPSNASAKRAWQLLQTLFKKNTIHCALCNCK